MGSLYKRNGFWYIDYYDKRLRVRRKISKSKRVAQIALADAMLAVEKKAAGLPVYDKTIEELFERYITYSKTNHSPSTVQRYKEVLAHFRKFLNAQHGKIKMLTDITPAVIEAYKAYRKKSTTIRGNGKGKNPSPKTINLELGTLKAMFNLAITWGHMDKNPAKGVKPLRVVQQKTPRFLTRKEIDILLKNAAPDFRPVLEVFLYTGMRKGELINLEWRDVDFNREVLHVRAKEHWTPKSTEREIPMNPVIKKSLLKLKKERKSKSKQVFTSKYGNPLKKPRQTLMRLTKRCGFPDVTKLHTLRHTFASHLVMEGVPLPTVQKLMGHADIQTTMIYAHLSKDHIKKAVGQLPY